MRRYWPQSIEFVLRWEGGLVDDPQDPGGLTNYGISIKAHPELGVEGIRRMTAEHAARIYQDSYWTSLCCDDMPAGIDLALFDAGVNQGVQWATKALQSAAGVTPDGVIGPVSLRAVHSNVKDVLDMFMVLRAYRYGTLSNLFPRFGKGWMKRLLSCNDLAKAIQREVQ